MADTALSARRTRFRHAPSATRSRSPFPSGGAGDRGMERTASAGNRASALTALSRRLPLRGRIGVAAAACAGVPLAVLLVAAPVGAFATTAVWLAILATLAMSLATGWLLIRTLVVPVEALIRSMRSFHPDADRPPLAAAGDGETGDAARQFERAAALMKARERDVQDKLDAAREAAKYNQLLQSIGIEIGGEMAAFSLPQLSQLALDRIRDGLGADVAILCLYDAVDDKRVSATSGLPESTIIEAPARAPCAQDICNAPVCPVLTGSMASRVAIPVVWGSTTLGELCVGYRRPHTLSRLQEDFLRDFCHMLAIGISNARLHWNLEGLATLEERERIAGDLHDGIIQSLYGTGLGLLDCIRLIEAAPAEARQRLEKTIDELNAVIRDVRSYIVGLESDALQRTALTEAVTDFVLRMSLNGSLTVELDLAPECDGLLTREQSGHLFQLCREAFLNIVKHARARAVNVRLAPRDGLVRLEISDDGQGFDPGARSSGGHGLKNIEARARRIGGTARIDSSPGTGTRITVDVPLDRAR